MISDDAGQRGERWIAAWCASVQGPYPIGLPTAQPEMGFVIPDPCTGLCDQSLRQIVRPDVWGRAARIRLSNALGNRPVTFGDVYVGLQLGSSAVLAGTNRNVTFNGRADIEIPPGGDAVSDPVALDFVMQPDDPLWHGRKLAVSLHVAGESGPMTWHAKALQTSYITPPRSGSCAADEAEGASLPSGIRRQMIVAAY